MIGVIIQARTRSTRFPRKIYTDLSGKTTLYRVLDGVSKNIMPNKIILCMPQYDEEEFNNKLLSGEFNGAIDDRFHTFFKETGDDLVAKYFYAAREHGIDLIVRVTGDCPFGGTLVDDMLTYYLRNNLNGFLGCHENMCSVPYPDGVNVEIFPYWMIADAMMTVIDTVHRDRVSPGLLSGKYNIYEFKNISPNKIINMRYRYFSFDTKEDRALLQELCRLYDLHNSTNTGSNICMADSINYAIKNSNFMGNRECAAWVRR